jgi:hypothetical protein
MLFSERVAPERESPPHDRGAGDEREEIVGRVSSNISIGQHRWGATDPRPTELPGEANLARYRVDGCDPHHTPGGKQPLIRCWHPGAITGIPTMSGIVTGIDYSLLFGGSSTTSDIATAMLDTIYNGGTVASTAVSTGNPLTDLKLAQANEATDVAQEAKTPQVQRDIAAFKAGIANAKDIQTALTNPNVMKVLLTGNNLASYIQYPALAQKALMSDPADSNSLVNKLGDTNLLNTAKSFDFANNGLAALQNPQVINTLANGYAEVLWRQSLEQATPGLSNALAFLGQASAIKSVDDILGDPVNRAVVLTALGIPEQIAFQDLTAQEQAVSSRVDVSKFQDPKFVTNITDQYLLSMQQQAQSSTTGSGSGLTTLAVQASGLLA